MFTTAITVKAVEAASTIQAAGVFDWVNEKTDAAAATIQSLLVLAGLIVGLLIAWKGKSVGSVLMAIVVGGLIASLPFLITFFGARAKDETGTAASHVVISVPVDDSHAVQG